jgi:hypothetical protein
MTPTRQAPRYPLKVPMKLRLLDSPMLPERAELSFNISTRGVYVASGFPYQIGERVEVTLTMPEQVAGVPGKKWLCHGRVVHTRSKKGTSSGAGVAFLYYEIVTASPGN